MSDPNLYFDYARKAWNAALDIGEKYGLKIFGFAFIIQSLIYPVVKVATKVLTGVELP